MLQRARQVNPLIIFQQVVKSVEESEDDVGSTISPMAASVFYILSSQH